MSNYHERQIDLPELHLGSWSRSDDWLANIKRYRSVRFIGVCWGRLFLGLIWGSPGASQLEATRAELLRVHRENDELRARVAKVSQGTV